MIPSRRGMGLIPVYAALVGWLTWPLAAHLATHVPDTWIACRFDLLQMMWALAHQSRALTTAPSSFADANIYHPARHALFYGDPGFGALPWFLPTFLATGNPALASNLVFLGSIALTAWALHVVVAEWTGSGAGAVLAAWTFLTSRWVFWTWVPSAPNYAVLQYLPFIMLLAATPRTGARVALGLLALVVLQGLTTPYVMVPTMAGLALLGVARLLRPATRPAGWTLVAVVAIAGIALAAANAGFWLVRRENPSIVTQSPWFGRESRSMAKLPWELVAPTVPTGVPLVVLVVIAAGAALALARWRSGTEAALAWRHGGLWTALGVVLSVTPTVLVFGRPVALGPLALSSWVPLLRKPDRLGAVALLGLCVLAGAAAAEGERWLRSHLRGGVATAAPAAAVVLVVLFMYAQYARGYGTPAFLGVQPLPAAYPLAPVIAADAPLMDLLRRPGGPLLEIPATWKLGGRQQPLAITNARAMYRSIFHRRRLVNGYDGYWPDGFPERMADADRLPDPAALARLREATGLELVLVHVGEIGDFERRACADYRRFGRPVPADCAGDLRAPERAAWLALAADGGRDDLRMLARDGDDLLFAVVPAR